MDVQRLTHEEVLRELPHRDVHAHKGDYGKILMLCGSRGYTGAAALAAMGGLRTGAGLVYLGVPACIYEIEAVKLLEPIVLPLPDSDGKLGEEAIAEIDRLLSFVDVVLVGPGLGISQGTFEITKHVLQNFEGPVVLDADGINVLKEHKDVLRGRTGITVLTPHEGEFLRLGGCLKKGRYEGASDLAKELQVVVVLKGHETVITDGYRGYINSTGNPGMAVGGSGDVLAGMIASLVAQGIDPLSATACAVWLHGAAGDACASEIGQYGMLPSDLLQVLPRLMK